MVTPSLAFEAGSSILKSRPHIQLASPAGGQTRQHSPRHSIYVKIIFKIKYL
jgi:hypothetical protein